MKTIRFLISVPILLLALIHSPAQAESFTSPSLRPGFTPQEIPGEWLPLHIPPEGQELKAFLELSESREFIGQEQGLRISRMIELCGRPSNYLVAKNKVKERWNYLVYDLPSGDTIILYVTAPPINQFGAAAAFDARGKLLRLIK